MTYDEWWLDFIATHEEWRYADSDALRKTAFAAGRQAEREEIEKLREQVKLLRGEERHDRRVIERQERREAND